MDAQTQDQVTEQKEAASTCGRDVPSADASGEELYARARAMPHRQVPTFMTDVEYLRLLGQSAEKGYPRALAKLGEYAMRRQAWVEAYYWMKLAQSWGMGGMAAVLREIRQAWAARGYPSQTENTHELFSQEAGSIGRALLSIDSRHDAYAAREYLKANHPEFL